MLLNTNDGLGYQRYLKCDYQISILRHLTNANNCIKMYFK